jgi:ectoine hydroxylase-related dioxygenase (phytanoyl-CoA dioxygenase family)
MDREKHLSELITNGYTLIPNLISEDECENYKRLLDRDYQEYCQLYYGVDATPVDSLANKSGEKVVFNLHNKDLSWFKMFENPDIISILDVILKDGSYQNQEPYYLNNISARCPLKGHQGQQLHIDSNLPGVNYCLIANVLWLLDDFTEKNGATRVVPGSHKWTTYPSNGEIHKDEILITGKKGSALIFNANLWHGGGKNTTNSSRWAVALGYARWFIKPSFDFMENTPIEIYNRLSDKQKDLLGFRLTPPKDEFTRLRRKSETFAVPHTYNLPNAAHY